MVYFTLLLPATCFGSIRAIFRLKYYLLTKAIYKIGNIVVDCEISHYVFKML